MATLVTFGEHLASDLAETKQLAQRLHEVLVPPIVDTRETIGVLARDIKRVCDTVRDLRGAVEATNHMLRNLGGASNDPQHLLPPAPPAQHGVMSQPARITLTSNEYTDLCSRLYQLEQGLQTAIRRDEASGKALADRINRLDSAASALSQRISDAAATSRKHILSVQADMESRIEHSVKEDSKDWGRVEQKVDELIPSERANCQAIHAICGRLAKLEKAMAGKANKR